MIILTHHAVEQYISRCDRSLSPAAAHKELETQIRYATRLRERTHKGDSLWELPSGTLVVTKPGPDGDVAVTLLRSASGSPNRHMPTEEEMELLLERVAEEPSLTESGPREIAFQIRLKCSPTRANASLVRERLERALGGAVGSLVKNGIAGAVIEELEFTVTEKESP